MYFAGKKFPPMALDFQEVELFWEMTKIQAVELGNERGFTTKSSRALVSGPLFITVTPGQTNAGTLKSPKVE